jgi:hypothetical protein
MSARRAINRGLSGCKPELGREGRRLYFSIGPGANFVIWLCARVGQSRKPAKKRRPKFKYYWPEARAFFDKLRADNGDLDDRPEWSAQADIERRLHA